MNNLFEDNGAEFSDCKKYRRYLWRIWDESLPLVMFIGLNPSKAGADNDDPTITKVKKIAKHNGFGGLYMLNCYSFIATLPKFLDISNRIENLQNDAQLEQISRNCKEVVFAWGDFKIVKDQKRDEELIEMFPEAKCLAINKSGSPKHPLYCLDESKLIPYR